MIVVRLTQLFDSLKQTLFILGSGLLIFLAVRNTLVCGLITCLAKYLDPEKYPPHKAGPTLSWHMQQFWGASGDFWQRQWGNLYDLTGQNDFLVSVVGSFIVTFGVFWLGNLFLILLDVTGWPAFLLKYKIQQDKNMPLSRADLMRAVKQVLFNQTFAGIPFSLLVYYLYNLRGCPLAPEDLPTFQWAVFEVTIFTLVEELCFYYSHRLFHHPKIYKYIHKRHHEWTASIGIVALYAHPIEHVFSNIMPPAIGPLLLGSHLATAWMFWVMAILSTIIAHCGYHFPFLPSPEAHDFHHLKFNQNYGVLGILDRLHGTDSQFRNSIFYKRHFLLLSLIPVAQQVPDPPKKKPE